MSSPEPPPEAAKHVIPRGPELEYSKEPLIIGENCFPDAVSLPPGVRDRGIADFHTSEVYTANEDRWQRSIERLEKVYTQDEIKRIMSKAADELEKKFLPMLDEMIVPRLPYPSWEDTLRAQGIDPDNYVAIGSEWRDGTLYVSLAQKTPPEYITINLTMVGDADAGQDEADGQAGREV